LGQNGDIIEIEPAECNTSVVFPGIDLGSVLCRTSKVTDKMLVAVEGVAGMSGALQNAAARLLPDVGVATEDEITETMRTLIDGGRVSLLTI
jgi:malate dehydrogenase (oxaloacetate-decarboxylating)